MNKQKSSAFSNGLIWFGAALSIAEILTGTYFAPFGLKKGILAIVFGHLIGCVILYFAGLIGAKTQKSSMETVKMSFGCKGSLIFSILNILQLVGWTAIMIINGASAASAVSSVNSNWIWCIIIGVLIIAWILMGLKSMNRVNVFAMGALFVLTVILSTVIFGKDGHYEVTDAITFGSAVELSVAMPLSWLPLISDYTRNAKKGKLSTFVSAAVYFCVSCWMYIIGLAGTLFTGETDISKIMVSAGLGIASLLIIVFSTVTTTFLDVYSAGVSSVSVSKKLKEKPASLIICVAGVLLAIFTPITQFENFLYLIGSVFAPMTAILICDYFIIKKDFSSKALDTTAIIVWCAGFIAYRLLMNANIPVGYTLPAMAITGIIDIAARNIIFHSKKAERK